MMKNSSIVTAFPSDGRPCDELESGQTLISAISPKLQRDLTYATWKQFPLKGKSRVSYLERVVDFPLASIKSDEHLVEAPRVIDERVARGSLDDGEEMYLDALSDLVASYEDQHYAIETASDADMLRHLMDAKGVNQIQLSRETGLSKSTISEILAGKKPFSRKIIHTLAKFFHVDIGVLAANF